MLLQDAGEISKRVFTKDGFLLVSAKIAKAGIQEYGPRELEIPAEANPPPVIRLLRPADEVFNPESLATLSNRPVTRNHPPEFVNAENWKKYQIGFSRDTIGRDGDKVTADLVIQDKAAIDAIQAGTDQVSLGYEVDVDWTPGVDERFGPFDGIQRRIRGNHIAILAKGRAGSGVRLDDHSTEEQKNMIKRTLNGITIELSDQGAEAFDAQSKRIAELETKIAAIETAEKTEINDAKATIERLTGELDATKKQILTDEQIDARVRSRAALVDRARKLDPEVVVDGKTDDEIRKAVAVKLADGLDLSDKSPIYISAVFDTLKPKTVDGSISKLADALTPKGEQGPETAETARARMIERNRNAWKRPAEVSDLCGGKKKKA